MSIGTQYWNRKQIEKYWIYRLTRVLHSRKVFNNECAKLLAWKHSVTWNWWPNFPITFDISLAAPVLIHFYDDCGCGEQLFCFCLTNLTFFLNLWGRLWFGKFTKQNMLYWYIYQKVIIFQHNEHYVVNIDFSEFYILWFIL